MSEPTKQGWCTKKGGFIHNWKKRWFVLNGKMLTYSETPESTKSKGQISLENASDVKEVADTKHPFKFVLQTKGRAYEIAAENQEECNSWIAAIKAAINGDSSLAAQSDAIAPTIPEPLPEQTSPSEVQESAPASIPNKISIDDFEFRKLIGQGAFGKVRLALFKPDGKIYALKSMRITELQENDSLEFTRKECEVMTQIKSNFIVQAYHTFSDEKHIYIMMDYLPGGELFTRISNEKAFTEERARIYCAQLAIAINDFHQNQIIHRDIKPENVLFGADGYLRLSDMGYVKKFGRNESQSTSTFCGTPMYIAPEMLQNDDYSYPVDWWDLGIILFEMIAGFPPFYDDNTDVLYRLILESQPEIPEGTSPECTDLINKLLEKDPTMRISSLESIKAHPFFNNPPFDWEALAEKRMTMEWIPELTNNGTENFDAEYTQQDPQNTMAEDVQVNVQGFTMNRTE